MVIEFKKNKIPPKYFMLLDKYDFWKYRQAKSNEVIEFYFTSDGKYDGIGVERIQWLKF